MNSNTYEKMVTMNLKGMVEAYKEQADIPETATWTFEQRLSHLIDREFDVRRDNKIKRLITQANFSESQAYLDGIKYYADRQLDPNLFDTLKSNRYITAPHNLIIEGVTGSGKSYIACALGQHACTHGFKVRYIRLPDLLSDIEMARAEGSLKNKLKQYKVCELLIIDEWLLSPVRTQGVQDLLEIIDRRYKQYATILCSQYATEGWHQRLGGSGIAESILDRLTSKAIKIKIGGSQSMREREV